VFSSSGVSLGAYPDSNGIDLMIGQMDQDAGIEIATLFGKVLDFDSGLMQCQFTTSYNIDALALADFDQDGMQELLYGNGWDATYAVDIDTCQVKWSIPANDIGDIIVGVTDMDGSDEFIIGED
jgi:outer membrane protein assembly factor BamB